MLGQKSRLWKRTQGCCDGVVTLRRRGSAPRAQTSAWKGERHPSRRCPHSRWRVSLHSHAESPAGRHCRCAEGGLNRRSLLRSLRRCCRSLWLRRRELSQPDAA